MQFQIDEKIDDNEILYHSVMSGRNYYFYTTDGELKISPQAFQDRYREPSVDRAKLCSNNPSRTRQHPGDGVVQLTTSEVREERVQVDYGKGVKSEYIIDAIYDPKDNNIAHSKIVPNPQYRNDTAFKKVRERLAILATKRGWVLEPSKS